MDRNLRLKIKLVVSGQIPNSETYCRAEFYLDPALVEEVHSGAFILDQLRILVGKVETRIKETK